MPPQNPVDGAIVGVSILGVKLAYPEASLAVRPARDRQSEPEAASASPPIAGKVIALPMVGGPHHR